MPTPELIPPSNEKFQFPICDIPEEILSSAAGLVEEWRFMTSEQRVQLFGDLERESRADYQLNATMKAHLYPLLHAWAGTVEEANPLHASNEYDKLLNTCLMMTYGFMRRTKLLPVDRYLKRFSEDFKSMQSHDMVTLEFFAGESWEHMFMSHPRTYEAMSAFYNYLNDTILKPRDIDGNTNAAYAVGTRATVALPYVIAAISRLEGYYQLQSKDDELMGLNIAKLE